MGTSTDTTQIINSAIRIYSNDCNFIVGLMGADGHLHLQNKLITNSRREETLTWVQPLRDRHLGFLVSKIELEDFLFFEFKIEGVPQTINIRRRISKVAIPQTVRFGHRLSINLSIIKKPKLNLTKWKY